MCCDTPFFECVEKNPATKHDGEYVPPYAQCRNSNHTSSCPCKNPPCIDYTHDYNLKIKLPWSCLVLTGGCSAAFKPCGPGKGLDEDQKKNWKGTPCCQWGCTCNYNNTWSAQCEPPKGLYACTKDAQKDVHHRGSILYSVESDREALPQAPRARSAVLFAAGAGTALFVTAAAVVVRRRRSGDSRYDGDLADAEADVDSN